MKSQPDEFKTRVNDKGLQAIIAGLAQDLTRNNPSQQPSVEQALKAMLSASEEIKSLAGSEPATVIVTMEGGLIQDVHSTTSLPFPLKLLVLDYDPKAYPELVETEWTVSRGI